MRINGFEQMKAFYSWVFNNQDKARQSHISLYMFLLNQNNRSNWSEWFKCPYDLAMAGSAIGSKSTYYTALDDLTKWKLIKYKKGQNNFKAPQISIVVLSNSGQVTVPLSEQVTAPLPVPLSEPLSVLLTGKIYKLLTDNHKLVTDNLEKWIKEEAGKSKRFIPPSKIEIEEFCFDNLIEIDIGHFIDHYTANGWKVGKNTMKDWKATVRNWNRNKDNFKNNSNGKRTNDDGTALINWVNGN